MKTCGHINNCGCKDTYLTTPPPCPTPDNCPDPQPCSEVFDAQCIIYTGDDIECDNDTVISQNTTVADALANIVDYFCGGTGSPITVVTAGDNITVTSNTVGNTTTYTVTGQEAIVQAGTGISVTSSTTGNDTTYTVSALCPMQVALTYTPDRGVEATVTGGTPPYTYNWQMADVRFGVGADSMFILTPGISPNYTLPLINPAFVDKIDMSGGTKQGSYGIVKSIVTDANGCIAKDIILLIDIAVVVP